MNKVLDDDDDNKWVYDEKTKAKHEVYQKYLTPWTYKLAKYNQGEKIRVVDCFAGRGFYVDTEDCGPTELECIDTPAEFPGSPQIILDRLTKHSNKFNEAEVALIEYNQNNFSDLEDQIEETSGIADNINITNYNGKFQEEVYNAVDSFDGSDCPTMFFIDPFGFKPLKYDVVTEITSTPQFDTLITFMARDMNRFFEVDMHEEAIRGVFGDEDFRENVEQYSAENWEPIVEYYTHRLEQNGPEYTFEYYITEPDSLQTVYYLVFGTNHPEGLKTMRDVMNTCGTGSFGYAPKDPEHDRAQNSISQFAGGLENTKNYLMSKFDGFRIEFNRMCQKCYEDRKYDDDTESDYRDAVQSLEQEGEVKVERITSENTGVVRGDLIDFRDEPDDPDEHE